MVARLVSEAMNKLSNSSENFYRFVSIIESRDTNLASILKSDYDLHHTRTVRGTTLATRFDHQAEQALGRPGKPHATNVTHNSLELSWEKPQYGADSVQSYTITYRPKNDPSNRWILLPATQLEHAEPTDLVRNLVAETVYYFKVRVESTSGTSGPYSESSDPIVTRRVPLTERMLLYCKHISSSPNGLKIYLLPTLVTTRKSDYQKVTVAHPQHLAVAAHKVLLLVGTTGAGKTSLVNAMANYIMGVDWEDEYRFKLISEETAHDQTKSQTKCTAYTFLKQKGSPLPYSLTVIDTPGFGNTRERDGEIFQQIKELLTAQGDEGIDQLHGIGFVTQAPQTRLTPTQRYVFDAILSVFGKDVADNIFLMVTFADGKQPPVLEAARTAGVPFKHFFMFDNSALFASDQANDELDKMFWKMGRKSFHDFFHRFVKAKTSLQQAREVLKERECLETAMKGLQPQIQAGLATIDELKQKSGILKAHEADIIANKDFVYTVTVTKQRKIDMPVGHYYHCRSAMICRDDLELRWRLLMCENEFSHISLLLYISAAF